MLPIRFKRKKISTTSFNSCDLYIFNELIDGKWSERLALQWWFHRFYLRIWIGTSISNSNETNRIHLFFHVSKKNFKKLLFSVYFDRWVNSSSFLIIVYFSFCSSFSTCNVRMHNFLSLEFAYDVHVKEFEMKCLIKINSSWFERLRKF